MPVPIRITLKALAGWKHPRPVCKCGPASRSSFADGDGLAQHPCRNDSRQRTARAPTERRLTDDGLCSPHNMYTRIHDRGPKCTRGKALPGIEHSAGERTYREIGSRIVSLELLPNTPAGGVSRTPVREAMTRLSGEGLVDFHARAGTIGVAAPLRCRRDDSACRADPRTAGHVGTCARIRRLFFNQGRGQ